MVDAGYQVYCGYMGPFKNTRYHLQEFEEVPVDEMIREEKFNWIHSKLRNVVERQFGILKERWHILEEVPLFPREKQLMIITSCFAMHNYLHSRKYGDGAETYEPHEWVQMNANCTMKGLREYIATALWE